MKQRNNKNVKNNCNYYLKTIYSKYFLIKIVKQKMKKKKTRIYKIK